MKKVTAFSFFILLAFVFQAGAYAALTPRLAFSSSLNPSTFGQNVTFTAHVDDSTLVLTPTGLVTFYDGTTSLGNMSLIGDSARLSTANLAAGSHTIKMVYGGDLVFNKDSTTITQIVNQAAPIVSLVSSLNPSTFGRQVTFKTKVDSGSRTPTGSVTFFDGVTSLGSAALTGDSALLNTGSLTAGTHTIKGVYSGSPNFKSDSATVTQTVVQVTPIVTLVSSLNPSTFGQNVTFKAKVDSGAQTPTGSVTFYDGATSLGNFPLTGDSAQVSTSSLTGGSHSVKAVYSGDVNFRSDSATITQTVNKAGPTVTLASSLNPSTFGQNVTFKAKVDSGTHTPTGSVTFYDGATSIGNVSLTGDSAQATATNLTAASHTIKAVYGGDGNFRSDSTTITQTVNKAGPTVTLTSSLNPSTFGQNVTFKAKVDSGTHTPTGTVTFYDGATSLGNVSLTGDSAQATATNLTAGSHTIKAVYGGDGNFRSDSTTITQTVNKAGPTVTLASGLNPSTFGQNVTFKAKVDSGTHTPTGSVTFYDGACSLGNVSIVGDSALVSSAALTSGAHTIKAVYGGDGNFRSDSTTITQTVNKAGPAVTLTSGLNPSTFGQNVTFKAKVDSGTHTPTGTVTFYDGATSLGNVSIVGDSALVSSAALTSGAH
ncbi:MAG TPA: Ig-like domain-containing protein, partial [Bacteroidota bacterium]|nr:Ig-like domain-containing protein [Bacteroidota bacterium]